MAHDYIPRRDMEFLGWSGAFSEQINATPAQFGLTPLLASQYAALHDAYVAALAAAADRARPAIATKKSARKAAEKQARALVRIIQAHPGMTDAMRCALRITVRDAEPTRVARPTDRPSISLKLLFGSTVRITLRNPASLGRRKPAGVAGAMVYSFVGRIPPDSLSEWTNHVITTRPRTTITLQRGIVPGSQVWFVACWYNPRGQSGPLSEAKSIHVACPTLMLENRSLQRAA